MNPVILYISLTILMMYAGFGLFIFLGFYITPLKKRESKELQFISILIPFRNEEKNLAALIDSLKKLDYPLNQYEIIFINDHSEDNGVDIIQQWDANHIQCIRSTGNGKKAAIACGIEYAKGNIIALTDADCILPPLWLNHINNATDTKMILGPVQLKPIKNLLHLFQEMEWAALQSISASTAFWKMPLMNNGANLAYEKSAFDESLLKMNTPSGDDMFMLEAVKQKKESIGFIWKSESIVTTAPAPNLAELVHQKVRWASKSKYYKNKFNLFIGVLTALMNAVVFFNCIYFPFANSIYPLCIVIAKWMADLLIMLPYLILIKKPYLLFFLFIFVIIYPIYFLFILMLSLKGKFIWKGRTYHA